MALKKGMKESLAVIVFAAVVMVAGGVASAANPCGMSNPCGTKNPCAAHNPCGMKNPCDRGGNKAIRKEHVTDKKALLKRGKALWKSEALGTSGLTCMTCHADHEKLHLDNKEPWPRHVKMTKDIVTLDQMINYCIINPLAGKPLDANSVDMTAMNAWYHEYVKSYSGE